MWWGRPWADISFAIATPTLKTLHSPHRSPARQCERSIILTFDRGHSRGVLQMLEDRRLADGAVLGLGQLRQRIELFDLAVERRISVDHSATR